MEFVGVFILGLVLGGVSVWLAFTGTLRRAKPKEPDPASALPAVPYLPLAEPLPEPEVDVLPFPQPRPKLSLFRGD